MKRLLMAATASVALLSAGAASAQQIGVAVFDNGTLIGSSGFQPGGIVNFTVSDANFSFINIVANGGPIQPNGTFIVNTLNVSATGAGSLTILATQIGNPNVGSSFDSTLTQNFLSGGANITNVNLQNFVDAVDAPWSGLCSVGCTVLSPQDGTSFNIATLFSLNGLGGTASSGVVPFTTGPLGLLFSETAFLSATFTGAGTLNTTAQIAAVPEPATWGMMLLGFVGLAWAFRSRRRSAQLPSLA